VDHPLAAHISTRYESSTRGQRISQLIESLPDGSMDESHLRALHMDVHDGEWWMLRPLLEQISGSYAPYMRGWDGVLDTARVAPTLYNSFRRTAMEMIGAQLDSGLRWLPVETHALHILVNSQQIPTRNGWIPTRPFVQACWDSSVQRLRRQLGPDPAKWVYGRYHQTLIQHVLQIPALSLEPFASPGNNRTLNVAGRLPSNHSASMRTLIQPGSEGSVSRLLLTGGQSGRFDSPHYRDQVNHWLHGVYHTAQRRGTFRPGDYVRTVQFRLPRLIAGPNAPRIKESEKVGSAPQAPSESE
jgi:acyl-homoserine lactone acylase PvdQ